MSTPLRRLAFVALALLIGVAPAAAQSLYSPPLLHVPAWTEITSVTRYPASGTFDVSDYAYVQGIVAFDADAGVSHGTVTFYWSMDPAGGYLIGAQGENLTSLIPGRALAYPNQGPYFFITYTPLVGRNAVTIRLLGSNASGKSLPGDTILVDVNDAVLAAGQAEPIYPCNYFAGEALVYLSAPPGVTVTLYGADLTDQFWPLDAISNGSKMTVTPLGTWLVLVFNSTATPLRYTLAVTPLLTGDFRSAAPPYSRTSLRE